MSVELCEHTGGRERLQLRGTDSHLVLNARALYSMVSPARQSGLSSRLVAAPWLVITPCQNEAGLCSATLRIFTSLAQLV